MDCKNCGSRLVGEFCHSCGQKLLRERFTLRQILRDLIRMLTNVEKGFWFTAKVLFRRPAEVIQHYLSGATVSYYNPFRYYFIIIAVSTLLQVSLGTFDLQQADIRETLNPNMTEEQLQTQLEVVEFMKKFLNFIPLLVLPFVALCFKWAFRRQAWNYAEHLISTTYIYAQTTILGITIIIGLYFVPQFISWITPMSMLISATYFAVTYRRIFQMSLAKAFFLSLLAILGGFLLMLLSIIVVGLIGILTYFILFK